MSSIALQLPNNYVKFEREEMEYVDGGYYIKKRGTFMIKKIKLLILFNLISYMLNFGFSFFYSYDKNRFEENWLLLGVCVLLPYLLLTITSFVLADDYNENYKIFKKEAIIDWIIRLISFIVVFQEFNFNFLSTKYFIQQGILVILFLISIYLEFIMYNKAIKNISNINKKHYITLNDKKNFDNIGKACTMGITSMVFYCAFALPISQTYKSGSTIVQAIAISLSLFAFIWYLYFNYKKCMLFYIDKKVGKNIFIKDALFVSIGYFMNFVEVFGIYDKSNLKSNLILIGCILLYPTITTNRKIALKYKAIQGELEC